MFRLEGRSPEIFWWFSRMDSRLLWALVATIVIVVFVDPSDGEEEVEEPGQTQDGRGEGGTATVRIIRTTQYLRRRWRPYRLGSLSALSRGLMGTVGPPQEKAEEEGALPQAREAGAKGPPFPVHSGTLTPLPKVD